MSLFPKAIFLIAKINKSAKPKARQKMNCLTIEGKTSPTGRVLWSPLLAWEGWVVPQMSSA